MEYTDYYVARATVAELKQRLEATDEDAVIVDDLDGEFVPFVIDASSDAVKDWDWVLRVYEAEGGAWGFQLWVGGEGLAEGELGENAEWGIDEADNGFDGELGATAKALGVDAAALEACFNRDSVDDFCELIGFEHMYCLYPHEMPEGVSLMSEF